MGHSNQQTVLHMKPVCLITGAGGRLGNDLCEALQDDYLLVATYCTREPRISSQMHQRWETSEDPVDESRMSKMAHVVQADLSRREDIRRLVEVALARYGRIDALINSAADIKFHGHLRDLWQADDYPQSQMLMNSIAPFQLASAIYHACWKDQPDQNTQWNRSVINVSSISGQNVLGGKGQAYYGASKAAMNILTLYLSLELSDYGVRANVICPSRFTSRTATRRVTNAIRELLSGDATGTIVTNVP